MKSILCFFKILFVLELLGFFFGGGVCLFYFCFVNGYVAHMYVCVLHAPLVQEETRRECQIT